MVILFTFYLVTPILNKKRQTHLSLSPSLSFLIYFLNPDVSRNVRISDSFVIPLNGKIGAHRARCHLFITDLFKKKIYMTTENSEVDTQSCMIVPEKT